MTAEEFLHFVDVPDRLARQIRTAAAIAGALADKGLRPVVVGGSAVEFYTGGSYTTVDIDMVVEGIEEIDAAVRLLGFRKLAGASYVHPRVDVVIDLPPEPLAGDPRRVVEVVVEGLSAYVIGLEDIIADRLRAAVYWQDLSSREWAVQLMAAQWESLDWPYLHGLANAEPDAFGEALEACRQLAERVVRTQFPDATG
jgi:hypothetical protein